MQQKLIKISGINKTINQLDPHSVTEDFQQQIPSWPTGYKAPPEY